MPSPFTVLTGLIDRPLPSQDDTGWMLDLQLMHHYLTHTRYILTEHDEMDNVLQIWQEEMPKVAFSSNYCMHALLGFAALHKAYLQPIEAPMLRTCAVDHLDKALVLYREHAATTTAENANAKFAFTWLVALFAYAIPPSVPPIDAIVELFLLVKGIDTILSETWYVSCIVAGISTYGLLTDVAKVLGHSRTIRTYSKSRYGDSRHSHARHLYIHSSRGNGLWAQPPGLHAGGRSYASG
jgi:hypothetical protein